MTHRNQAANEEFASATNLVDLIEGAMKKYATFPAYHCLGHSLTYAEVDQHSRHLAAYLQQACDLQTGDRVAIQLPNINQFPIAAFAVLRAGLVLVNINPLYTPREMQHQLADSGAKAIIILADLMPKLTPIVKQTQINKVIACQLTDLIPSAATAAVSDAPVSFGQALTLGSELTFTRPQGIHGEQLGVLQYTGGTTGLAKGAMLTHTNMLSNICQASAGLGDACGNGCESFVTPLPLYHVYAFMMNLLLFAKGNLNVLVANPRDLDRFVKQLAAVRFTGICGINTLFAALCQHPEFKQVDFSGLKLTLSGGAALSAPVAERWQAITGCSVCEGYGLSETSPLLTLNSPETPQQGSVGKPVMDTDIEIWDEQGQPLPVGEAGELVARGPQIMAGYWLQPGETDKVLTSDGWFKTGDIGMIQADGLIKIVDRKKDMIIVSGFNVYPNEIEEVLQSLPGVQEAAVIGELCEQSGEKVCAYIVADGTLTGEQVVNFARSQLTAYKVPKKVVFQNELPKSAVGKVLRKDLRAG